MASSRTEIGAATSRRIWDFEIRRALVGLSLATACDEFVLLASHCCYAAGAECVLLARPGFPRRGLAEALRLKIASRSSPKAWGFSCPRPAACAGRGRNATPTRLFFLGTGTRAALRHSLVEVALNPSWRLSCVEPRVLPRGAGLFFAGCSPFRKFAALRNFRSHGSL